TTLPDDMVAYIAVPIMDGDTPIGVLAAHRLRMRPRPVDADLIILRILATFIAQIIKINNLIDERTSYLQEENRELKDALQTK
ncbi:GAF domain-containing protein, partial [Psychrobacter sp. TB55-MNA-CIBAN-0194]|uniref:GAF domain-containing protein n=1 Tax=Psychrobacter sp. TB55-MNA-CIBAN-0194 TaxID=3140445 RepID=UPI00333112CC